MNIKESLARRIPSKLKALLQIGLRICNKIMLLSPGKRINVVRFKRRSPLKLNVGCGEIKIPGWINIDIKLGADLVIDVRKGLPFDDNSVDFIYNEHFLEHLTFEEAEKVLRDFYRCLKKGGILRIATPDLDYIIQRYNADWKNQDWLSWPEYESIKTRGMMINIAFRWWGHKYLYNEEDLTMHLVNVGFKNIKRCEWNQSTHIELRGLETRKDSKLILEAEKI